MASSHSHGFYPTSSSHLAGAAPDTHTRHLVHTHPLLAPLPTPPACAAPPSLPSHRHKNWHKHIAYHSMHFCTYPYVTTPSRSFCFSFLSVFLSHSVIHAYMHLIHSIRVSLRTPHPSRTYILCTSPDIRAYRTYVYLFGQSSYTCLFFLLVHLPARVRVRLPTCRTYIRSIQSIHLSSTHRTYHTIPTRRGDTIYLFSILDLFPCYARV
jgi:hypothetical protein